MNKLVGMLVLSVLFIPSLSLATTDYARQTGFDCKECHVDAIGGGPLTRAGEQFVEEMKLRGLYRPLNSMQKIVRLIIGYVHLITAIAWFGTILYVHILLKPAYAAKGLPRGELFLGWMSIILMAVTGTLLSISRVPSWSVLFTTRFGILLSIKIILFLIMASSAFIVTFFVGPRMKKRLKAGQSGEAVKGHQDLAPEELHHFDGKEGRPAYIAFSGKIYDVTESRLWKDGSHARKHQAGNDLTDVLKTAPHGEEKVLAMRLVGNLKKTSGKPVRRLYERIFYFFAYMNLLFVFLIAFVIALMRWG
jgi:predicted heme/steroid binding protein